MDRELSLPLQILRMARGLHEHAVSDFLDGECGEKSCCVCARLDAFESQCIAEDLNRTDSSREEIGDRTSREIVYDQKIAPLCDEIKKICRASDIPYFMIFGIGEDGRFGEKDETFVVFSHRYPSDSSHPLCWAWDGIKGCCSDIGAEWHQSRAPFG